MQISLENLVEMEEEELTKLIDEKFDFSCVERLRKDNNFKYILNRTCKILEEFAEDLKAEIKS